MKKKVIAFLSVFTVLFGSIAASGAGLCDAAVVEAMSYEQFENLIRGPQAENNSQTQNAESQSQVTTDTEATDPPKPDDSLLKPGQHWEQYTSTDGSKGWVAIPVEPDPTPLGSVVVNTYSREDGSTYGVDKHGYYGKSDVAAQLSTTAVPTLDDFAWFLGQIERSGVPQNADNIHHPEDAVGDWKCLVVYDPLNSEGKKSYHLGTLHMDCKQFDGVESLSPHIEWNYSLDKDKVTRTDESGKDFFLSFGNFTDGWYGADGSGNMSFRMWTTGDGRQYAWGAAKLPDSNNNYVVLVR